MVNHKFIAIALLMLSFTACKLQAPELREIKNVETERLALTSVELRAKAVLYNPNRLGLRIDKPSLDLYLNDYAVGQITTDQNIRIRGRKTFEVPVKFRLGPKDTFRDGADILTRLFKGGEMKIKLKGSLNIRFLLSRKKLDLEETKSFSFPKLF
jgi:LEA14-like dessication related protein